LSTAAKPNSARLEHPYLFFTARELPILRARLEQEPFAGRWREFLTVAGRRLDLEVPVVEGAMGMRRSRGSMGTAGLEAFAHVVTGRREYGERALAEARAMLGASRWMQNTHRDEWIADLATAEAAAACAMIGLAGKPKGLSQLRGRPMPEATTVAG